MDQKRLFVLACVLFSFNGRAKSGANYSCSQWNCSFVLFNQKEAQEQFNSIDQRKVWLVNLKIEITSSSSQLGNNEPLMVAWAKSEDSPFLSFDRYFEIFSFSMLSEAVKLIRLQAKSGGSNSWSDCLKQSSLQCRYKTISKAILKTLTNKEGVVCFGESPSRRCCKSNHEDVKCGIIPDEKWRWLNGRVCVAILFAVIGINVLWLLVYFVPSLPAPRNGIEVTSLLDPSPLSFSNLLSNCFNNKPVRCFKDALIIFCSRITVLLGFFPSGIYLSLTTFRLPNHIIGSFFSVYFLYLHFSVFAVYVVAVSVFPFFQYWYHLQNGDTEIPVRCKYRFCIYLYCWLSSFGVLADLLKIRVKHIAAGLSSCSWYFLPFCCQDKRNISNPNNIPIWLFFVLSPFIFVFIPFFFSLSSFLILSLEFSRRTIITRTRILGLSPRPRLKIVSLLIGVILIFSVQLIVFYNSLTFSFFGTYTIIGLIISYKLYLPFLSGVFLVVFYVYQCYRSTNESFDELRRILFEVCPEMEIEREEQSQHEELQPGSASRQLQRQLVYIDEVTGSRLIPKELFTNICLELNPVDGAFFVLVIKLCVVIFFVVALVSVVVTLTPRSEFGNVAQAAIALLVGLLPRILELFSKNSSKEKQHIMETESRIRYYVKKYLENGTLSYEEFMVAKKAKIKNQYNDLLNRLTEHIVWVGANRPREDSPSINA